MTKKDELYIEGLRRVLKFLDINGLPYPVFMTYAEAFARPLGPKPSEENAPFRVLRAMGSGARVGAGTGLYTRGHIFVNVPVTAFPQQHPAMRSWSWPGWKTDRTAIGVVAHETGHHVEHQLQLQGKLRPVEHGAAWRELIRRIRKTVSGYEPVPSEAWAETLRLFILNPYLLKFAIPERYAFVRHFLKPSEKRTWREVLNDHPAYVAAGERWIA